MLSGRSDVTQIHRFFLSSRIRAAQRQREFPSPEPREQFGLVSTPHKGTVILSAGYSLAF